MQRILSLFILVVTLSTHQISASCPANLCDCSWSTPGFSVLGQSVGSVTIGVCTVLPNAVVDLYHNEIQQYTNYITNEDALIAAATDAMEVVEDQFKDVIGEVSKLESTLGIKQMEAFFTNDDILYLVDDLVDELEETKTGIMQGLVLPVQLVTLFPELLNGVNPDLATDFIKERGEQIITWFTESLMDVSQGIGSESCSTCLVDNLNNGVISFDIGVDTGPGLSLTLILRTTQSIECLVNSFAELAKILHDSIPEEIEQGWDAVSESLIISAQSLADASEAVVKSDYCNTKFDIPSADFGDTGVDLLDDFTSRVEDIVNTVGADGPFAKILQTVTDGVCDAASFEGFKNFAVSLRKFLDIVSFSSIENRILKGLFGIVNRMSINLGTFRLENFDLDVETCNINDRACRLAVEYGSAYVKCLQGVIQSQQLAFSMTLSFGEHWVPPSVVGYGGSVTCADLDCVQCVFGLDNDGHILGALKFIAKEVFQLTSAENTENPECEKVLDCGADGTFDENICACRCSSGFIAGTNGCFSCPKVNGNICNNKGSCYIEDDTAKCCCIDGITTEDCS